MEFQFLYKRLPERNKESLPCFSIKKGADLLTVRLTDLPYFLSTCPRLGSLFMKSSSISYLLYEGVPYLQASLRKGPCHLTNE